MFSKRQLDTISGVITPSTAMGDFLLDRLVKNSGLTFDIKNL